MTDKNISFLKGRGIAFIDAQKVKTKGSEVGYSLQTIERILALKTGFSAGDTDHEIR
jgi:hypothetical protein